MAMFWRVGLFSGDVPKATLVVFGAILVYFIWMDVILYKRIQSLQPLHIVIIPAINSSGPTNIQIPQLKPNTETSDGHSMGSMAFLQPKKKDESLFSPFAGLSVKLMMMDHINHYLENPLAFAITKVFHLGTQFLWITPNMLSFLGLTMSIMAARLICWDGRCWHLTALILLLGRGLMDALDGIIARERKGIVQYLSIHNTTGFVVDSVCDTTGFTLFLLGCFLYLRRTVPKQYQPLPVLYQGDKPKRKSDSFPALSHNGIQWTTPRIFSVVFCFGLQVGITAVLWDRYCTSYHELLETPRTSESQAIVQNEILKSTLMWIVIWLWRVANAHALLSWFQVAIFLNKMWEFLIFVQYIGLAAVSMLFLFTEIHMSDVTAYVNTVH